MLTQVHQRNRNFFHTTSKDLSSFSLLLHTCDTFLNPNREIWNFWSGNLCLVSGGFHVVNFGPFLTKVKVAKSSDISRNMLQSITMSTYANRSENMRPFTV